MVTHGGAQSWQSSDPARSEPDDDDEDSDDSSSSCLALTVGYHTYEGPISSKRIGLETHHTHAHSCK